MSLDFYKLDPCHYYTSPGLSFDALLKMSGISLQLLTDVNMHLFFERAVRGGISNISHRRSDANNIYMKNYDEDKESVYISYIDADNLYAWGMSQCMPYKNFRWMSKSEIKKLNLNDYKADSEKGIILEIDLDYPVELHDYHNNYPLCPENIKVKNSMLSPYCEAIQKKFNISIGQVEKLIPSLYNKKIYILHFRNLQLYTDLGMVVRKVHRVLEFSQSSWMKKYIDFNTERRKAAKNQFEVSFFKLMNNSVFGKTIENLRKRISVKLINSPRKLLKWSSRPSFKISKIFNENLVAVHQIKQSLVLNRPVYLGMCILELSKVLMYDFHYNYVKNKYGDKAKLLFTDTDSLMYEIKTKNVYKDFQLDRDKYYFSDYPKNSPFYDETNKKVLAKFKDETAGIPIIEFIGLRSKLYSYVTDNEKCVKKAKGIKKIVVRKNITHEHYKNVLLNSEQTLHSMKTIRSQNHELHSCEINKISLSCFDDKRYILDGGIKSYAYGHYKIPIKSIL